MALQTPGFGPVASRTVRQELLLLSASWFVALPDRGPQLASRHPLPRARFSLPTPSSPSDLVSAFITFLSGNCEADDYLLVTKARLAKIGLLFFFPF